MTGIVNKTGSRSGAIGTITQEMTADATVSASGSETLTNKDLSGTNNTLPAGSNVQVAAQSEGTGYTQITGQNQWNNTVVIGTAFSPRYSNSRVRITGGFGAVLLNTGGDGGYACQWKREYSGHNSTPTNLGTSRANNRHGMFYRNPAGTNTTFHQWHTLQVIDTPATTSAITYRMQGAFYNAESCQMGGQYEGRWFVGVEEIKV